MMEDGISLLPDSSLVEIISRLDSTEETIRTSILSKRWKHLWTRVPNLDFHYTPLLPNRIPEFISYIEKVVTQRGQWRLNKFVLYVPYDSSYESIVSKLIRYVVTCNVQDLELVLAHYILKPSKFVLDRFFFINSSFKRLKLVGCLFDNATGVISWSNLKLLTISHAKLDEDLVKNILSGSPLLETLYLICCHGFGRIDITSPSVNKLVVTGYGERGYITDYWMTGPLSGEEKEDMVKGQIVSLRCVKKLKIGFYIAKILSRLEAKGFTFPSNMKYPELSDHHNDFKDFQPVNNITDSDWSTDNEGSDNDSTASEE